jgi:hypothetical protein
VTEPKRRKEYKQMPQLVDADDVFISFPASLLFDGVDVPEQQQKKKKKGNEKNEDYDNSLVEEDD